MKRIALFVVLFLSSTIYADSPSTIQEGAQGYDWETCLYEKSSNCINGCANSSDINCSDNCNQMAKDKCISEGLQPPQGM